MPLLPFLLSLLLMDHKLGLGDIMILMSMQMTRLYLAHEKGNTPEKEVYNEQSLLGFISPSSNQ